MLYKHTLFFQFWFIWYDNIQEMICWLLDPMREYGYWVKVVGNGNFENFLEDMLNFHHKRYKTSLHFTIMEIDSEKLVSTLKRMRVDEPRESETFNLYDLGKNAIIDSLLVNIASGKLSTEPDTFMQK